MIIEQIPMFKVVYLADELNTFFPDPDELFATLGDIAVLNNVPIYGGGLEIETRTFYVLVGNEADGQAIDKMVSIAKDAIIALRKWHDDRENRPKAQ